MYHLRISKQVWRLLGVLIVFGATGLLIGSLPKAATPIANYAVLAQEDGAYDFATDVAQVVIHAPEVGEVGELIRLDVSDSTAESFRWLLVPESIDFEVYDNGQRAVFSARRPGDYMFIVACAYKGTVDVTTHVVTIRGDQPLPPDDGTPDIPAPDENASVGEWLLYWCIQEQVPAHEALLLAQSFESVAATIAAGVNTTPQEIVEATAVANRQALGPAIDSWQPVLQQLQTLLRTKAENGSLVTAEQHANVWREIATGLQEYAAFIA